LSIHFADKEVFGTISLTPKLGLSSAAFHNLNLISVQSSGDGMLYVSQIQFWGACWVEQYGNSLFTGPK